MSNLLDLSEKTDPLSAALFVAVNEAAASLGMEYFVVGASARDMILALGYGQQTRRATFDQDFGVRVASWNEFDRLKSVLLATGIFQETKPVQRLLFQGELEVDIVPFGGIADDRGEIRWPPHQDIAMSTVGFEDAYHSALNVRVKSNPPLDIRVASPPGLTMLKLISWSDHPHRREKDALDLVFILEHYLDAGNLERLYDEHLDLVEVADFDYVRAGARLLGRDIARIAAPKTLNRIREILADATAEQKQPSLLIRHMMPKGSAFEDQGENRFAQLLTLLWIFAEGLNDV
jgi:predicted nucleotidyltransferase